MTVGVVFSSTPAGQAALREAARESLRRGVDLAVLAVVDTAEHAEAGPEVEAVRDETARRIAEVDGGEAVTWRVETAPTRGDIAEVIVDLAVQVGADPLVIGARRRSPVGKLILGSTVRSVLMDAPMAVLVTKA
ncbi:universal stress protein [Serinibacter arcticus]|uniref:Universal stress protein n=1 Tax=Serinibacter arcticus TaxID=1655435 RepID=A0A2U1ZY67_9MICO|nr:universal stress protein [Serinibacter arcticus]PWD51862.1 universal stress protein [Serinibacter arcticus]